MFDESDLIPVSALQHTLFCERQYALIHIEQAWAENRYTIEGNILHERVDVVHHESRRGFRVEYGLALRSLRYGLIGKADMVEFMKNGRDKYESISPVEFKRGRKKADNYDLVQLCAQALCLEEMFGTPVTEGQIYYLQEHRRTTIPLDDVLREQTFETIQRTRTIFTSKVTPRANYDSKKCDRCSLFDICMPKALAGNRKPVSRYLENQIHQNLQEKLE
ncbi:CRISPR-associated protein Cas4 [Spirochaeta lutea]|uniref:CRISPR-associated exonuclease Cas4 n=2 Tax=Spirochaeta lutea TaxID=1480694 RepID=A0A098QWB6_9SPIO|nr:CRISPR-associated protein Cas4 [Spirochaeta lutea]